MNENVPGKQEIIQHLKSAESLYILISACTSEPYVICDPETFDDEIYLFFSPEDAKDKAGELAEDKIPVNVSRMEKEHMLTFYTCLNAMGVNALVVKEGKEEWRVQLADFVRRDRPAQNTDTHLWVENPELNLTSLYYLQETRREAGQDNPKIAEWQEEISNYFARGSYILPVQKEGEGIPVVKLNDGQVYQAVFTDIIQYQKFNGGNELRPVVVTADKIPQVLVEGASGVLVNPMGIRMPIQVKKPEIQEETEAVQS